MENPMSLFKTSMLAAAVLALGAVAGPALAQTYNNDVVVRCSKMVDHMRFAGDAAERNKDATYKACLANNGEMPETQPQ
jgi:hypothetical protein